MTAFRLLSKWTEANHRAILNPLRLCAGRVSQLQRQPQLLDAQFTHGPNRAHAVLFSSQPSLSADRTQELRISKSHRRRFSALTKLLGAHVNDVLPVSQLRLDPRQRIECWWEKLDAASFQLFWTAENINAIRGVRLKLVELRGFMLAETPLQYLSSSTLVATTQSSIRCSIEFS